MLATKIESIVTIKDHEYPRYWTINATNAENNTPIIIPMIPPILVIETASTIN